VPLFLHIMSTRLEDQNSRALATGTQNYLWGLGQALVLVFKFNLTRILRNSSKESIDLAESSSQYEEW